MEFFTRKLHRSGDYAVISIPVKITRAWLSDNVSNILYHIDEDTNAITIMPYEEK